MNRKIKKILLILGLLIIAVFSIDSVLAQVIFKPQITVGTEFPAGEAIKVSGLTFAHYIRAFYTWSVRAIAILAVIMIMIAGFRWITSAGNAPAISQAKDQMISAIIGLVLALGANLLLFAINPALTRFKDLKVENIRALASKLCPGVFPYEESGTLFLPSDISEEKAAEEGPKKCVEYCVKHKHYVNKESSKSAYEFNIYKGYCCSCGRSLEEECGSGEIQLSKQEIDQVNGDYLKACCEYAKYLDNPQVISCKLVGEPSFYKFACVWLGKQIDKGKFPCEQEKCAKYYDETFCSRHNNNDGIHLCIKAGDKCVWQCIQSESACNLVQNPIKAEDCTCHSSINPDGSGSNCYFLGPGQSCKWCERGKVACEQEPYPSLDNCKCHMKERATDCFYYPPTRQCVYPDGSFCAGCSSSDCSCPSGCYAVTLQDAYCAWLGS